MKNRSFSAANYRFGFNGKEQDGETAADAYDFGARIYDARLGRWMAVDALAFKIPGISKYNFSLNSPVVFADIDGKDIIVTTQGHAAEVMKILSAAFGNRGQADFCFSEVKGIDGKITYTLRFTGNISDYPRMERRLLEPLLKLINEKGIKCHVYFQKYFTESDVARLKQFGVNAKSTDDFSGEAIIPLNKQKNDYSESSLYVDPENFVNFPTGRLEVVKKYKNEQNE
jgi:RHS repeat-associated protein